ncbi:MAG: hypothetical protein ACK5U6_17250 [Pseudanabaena sp.]|jgi:hypothetical protein
MNIVEETKVYIVQLHARGKRWVDTDIKKETIEGCKELITLNESNPFFIQYAHRIVKRITTVLEEECS